VKSLFDHHVARSVAAFVIIAVCGICIRCTRRHVWPLLATGITLLISLQAAINIGVVTSALPNKACRCRHQLRGSNLLAMLTCIGIC